MITPERTIPTPPPTPRIAESRPIPPATLSSGNSSRTIPKASGKIPPPTPWMKRAAISSGSELATAPSRVPKPSRIRVQSSSRSLPYISPRRPMIEVPTEAASR